MWNLKYDTNELIYETETDLQIWRTDFYVSRGRKMGLRKRRAFHIKGILGGF